MFTNLRKHFGTAGLLVAVLALVAALGGSAVAANGDGAGASAKNRKGGGNVNKLIKRESQKFSKRFSRVFSKRFAIPGPRGPVGFPGLPGSDGDDGDDGDDGSDGSDGSDGTNGKSVVTRSFTGEEEELGEIPGEPCNFLGGTEVETEGSSEPGFVCNGEEGSPWTAGGTLPPGATITGSYGANYDSTVGTPVAAEFNIPLAAPISSGNAHVIDHGESPPAECDDGEGDPASPANPEADSGHFCVFVSNPFGDDVPPMSPGFLVAPAGSGAAGRSGALITFSPGGSTPYVTGTWAVTG